MNQSLKRDDLQARIQALFPAGIHVWYSAACPANAELLPEEQAHTAGMVAKRVEEFTHGRHCARRAMAMLGTQPAAIHKRDDRSPAWPSDVCGSITHTQSVAAAAVGWAREYIALGIDIEAAEPLEDATAKLVVRPDEMQHNGMGARAKLLFSIKEAIYKCIHPVVQTYVDFQEMQVDLSGPKGTFRAIPRSDSFDAALIADLEGRYLITDEWLISAAWLPASTADT